MKVKKKFIILYLLFGSLLPLFGAPELVVKPQEVSLYEKVSILVKGLSPFQEVTVTAQLKDQKNRVWASSALFRADKTGMIDLTRKAPVEGTYEGIDSMGLFWSMQLKKEESDHSVFWHASLDPMEVEIGVQVDKKTKLKKIVSRKVASKGIKKIEIEENGLFGALFLPSGNGPFPCVIVLGGIEGGKVPDAYVAQLANHGFSALALTYLGVPGMPQEFEQVPLEYFQRAIEWLKERKEIHPNRLALLGTSLGGVASLLIASLYPDIRAVATLGGGGEILNSWEGMKSLFSYKDKAMPCLSFPAQGREEKEASFLIGSNPQLEAAAIAVEKINGPILMIAGLDDHLFASAILSHLAYNRLKTRHFKHPYQLIVYNGVGHLHALCSLPYCPTTKNKVSLDKRGNLWELGGNAQDWSKAQVDLWRHLFEFLHRSI